MISGQEQVLLNGLEAPAQAGAFLLNKVATQSFVA
jgi:hypothetical protein